MTDVAVFEIEGTGVCVRDAVGCAVTEGNPVSVIVEVGTGVSVWLGVESCVRADEGAAGSGGTAPTDCVGVSVGSAV